ncbi:hypothetical protein AB0H17_09450 [Streptomyces olivoreticuli]
MEIATVRRTLNHTLAELKRAIDNHAVAEPADLYALAWQQAADAPPSETREQRTRLQSYKEILASRRWRDEERRQAASAPPQVTVPPERTGVPRPRSVPFSDRAAEPAPTRKAVAWSSDGSDPLPAASPRQAGGQAGRPAARDRPSPRTAEPALLEAGRLWEIASELRPLLEQTARAGSTTGWPLIRKRLPGLPRLHRADQGVVLWLVDEDRREGEPLLSALVTVGNRQMPPSFPEVAEQLGLTTGRNAAQQQSAWSYEVLKVHQYWRHRR